MTLRSVARRIPGARAAYHAMRGPVPPSWYAGAAWKKIRIDRDVPGFSELATRIISEGRTLLDYDRLYTLWQLLADPVVEVGTYKGGSARFMADAGAEVWACDTFAGHPVVSEDDGSHVVGAFADVGDVRDYLRGIRVIEGSIMDTAGQLPERIGLLHIDVDVYPATRFCLEELAPRADVVVVDDYGFTTCPGAKRAVDEWLTPEWRRLHLITGQAVLTRSPRPRD